MEKRLAFFFKLNFSFRKFFRVILSSVIIKVPEAVFENGVWKGTKINFPEGYHQIGKRILAQFRKYPDFIGQVCNL